MYQEDKTMQRMQKNGYDDVRESGCGCEGRMRSEMTSCGDSVCGCEGTRGLTDYPIGMVYAVLQRFDNIYDLDTAMKRGTIFAELDLPFVCGEKTKGGCCND